jgi:hypothetical protein
MAPGWAIGRQTDGTRPLDHTAREEHGAPTPNTACPALCRAPTLFLPQFGPLQDVDDRGQVRSRAGFLDAHSARTPRTNNLAEQPCDPAPAANMSSRGRFKERVPAIPQAVRLFGICADAVPAALQCRGLFLEVLRPFAELLFNLWSDRDPQQLAASPGSRPHIVRAKHVVSPFSPIRKQRRRDRRSRHRRRVAWRRGPTPQVAGCSARENMLILRYGCCSRKVRQSVTRNRIDRLGGRRTRRFHPRLNDFRSTSNPAAKVLLNVRLLHFARKDKEMAGSSVFVIAGNSRFALMRYH